MSEPKPTIEEMLRYLRRDASIYGWDSIREGICATLVEYQAYRDAPVDPSSFRAYLMEQVKAPSFARTFLQKHDLETLKAFVGQVEQRAEADILAGEKLEGAHYRALKAELRELEVSPIYEQ